MAWWSFMVVSMIFEMYQKASYRRESGRLVFEDVPDRRRPNAVVVFDVLGYQSRDNISPEM
jgi:hypothetical protein